MWKGGVLPGRWLGSSTLSSSRGETIDDRRAPPNDSNIRVSTGKKTVRSTTRRPKASSQRPLQRGQRPGTVTTVAHKIHHHHHRGAPPQLPPQLSHNAAHALYTGRRHDDDDDDDDSVHEKGEYALEFDCEESVSSLNDSCFGGASVTGGYNIYSTEEPPEEITGSPLKQATSLAVGRVPSIMCLPSVSDHPSFDTEDLSYFVHDVEQPTILPPVKNNNIDNCDEVECENSLINAKNGRLRTMMPILTGTLSPKPKRRSDIATTNHPQVRSSNQPKEDVTSIIISTTSSESHREGQIVKATTSLPHTATTTLTPSSSHHDQHNRTNEVSFRCGTRHCLWYRRVPFWWKVLLITGWMLLILAILMALIGGIVAKKKNHNQSTSDATAHTNPSAFPVFVAPTSTHTFITETPTVSPTTRRKSNKDDKSSRRRW